MPLLPLPESAPVDCSMGALRDGLAIGVRARRALRSDLPAIVGLLDDADDAAGIEDAVGQVAALAVGDFFLVLDRLDGGLAGAVHVRAEGELGHLRLVSVGRDLRGHGLELRLVEIARGLCAAAGCRRFAIDLPAYLATDATSA